MNTSSKIHTRPASSSDQEFIVSLLPRLEEFGPPAWRNAAQMLDTDVQVLREALLNTSPETVIFIAEDDQGVSLGFIHLQSGKDYYYHEAHGHIANIIVAPGGEGRGIGRILMTKGEEWARSQGFRWLTLSVFAQNHRARELYERLGYGEDIMKYVKEID
jgi:ribosomal protein S18 acetylase RimI-like enzyme